MYITSGPFRSISNDPIRHEIYGPIVRRRQVSPMLHVWGCEGVSENGGCAQATVCVMQDKKGKWTTIEASNCDRKAMILVMDVVSAIDRLIAEEAADRVYEACDEN